MATVVDFGGSDKLLVQNDTGLMYKVQYIGVRGPVRSSIRNGGAAAFHGQLVVGQRVSLESDGKDEEQGYKLRHAYLEGNPVPLGGMVIGAGWATAVPYPLDHRHRGLYLQVQEQAMAQQVNLWQPGIFGPAAPWRPAGSAADGYVAADPRLHASLELLYTVPTGQSVLDRLLRMGIIIVLRGDIPGAAGTTEPLGNHIELNDALLRFDPHVLAVIIGHEGTHAIDHTAGAMDLVNFSCFEMEQRAYGIEANTWAEYYGPAGKPDPKDDGERSENYILGFHQRGDLENFVRRSPAYERQCAGERVPG
jgi:endonuclease YncB( thermonuclease family)